MSQNPLNLTLRFVLELAGLYAFGAWGWIQHAGSMRYLLVIVLPLIAGDPLGLFRVPWRCQRERERRCRCPRLDASADGNYLLFLCDILSPRRGHDRHGLGFRDRIPVSLHSFLRPGGLAVEVVTV